jgi:MFS superfamily sulfate permease-like transporter
MWVGTFIITLVFDIQAGVLSGIGISIATLLWSVSRPNTAVRSAALVLSSHASGRVIDTSRQILARLPGTDIWRNKNRYPDAVEARDVGACARARPRA